MYNKFVCKYNTNEIIKGVERDMAMFDKAIAHSYEDYVRYDLASTQNVLTRISGDIMMNFATKFEIKDIIFNPPATIVLWKDGTKTVVKAQDGCEFNPWVGMAMACSKKMLGNKGNYFKVFKKYCEPYEEKMGKKQAWLEAINNAVKQIEALKIPKCRIEFRDLERKEEQDIKNAPVVEAYIKINNFLNGKDDGFNLDEIRGLLGEALE